MQELVSIEMPRELSYLWGSCRAFLPVISISIAFTATIEIVFRFFLLRRREKHAMKRLKEHYEKLNQELAKNDDETFWKILRRKVEK